MSENYVNYEVLENGTSIYGKQAENIVDIMSTITSMNGELEQGFRNETGRAFLERYKTEFEPALQNLSEALASIATYLENYKINKMDEDSAGAAGLSQG